jgi:acetyl esterase/lipase
VEVRLGLGPRPQRLEQLEEAHASSRLQLARTCAAAGPCNAGAGSNVEYAGGIARAARGDQSDLGQGHPRQRGNDACALYADPGEGTQGRRDDRARLAYGPDARHRLDLHKPEGRTGVPIVVYLHGGAYVRGSRSVNAEVYGNVATYFARQGMLGVNGTYRLAPEAQWPAAAQDVGLLVQWLKANAAAHGSDPTRICLIGNSAGATHVATFVYQKDLQAANGAAVPVGNLRPEILVVHRPELASPACDRQSGRHAGSARPCAAIGAYEPHCNIFGKN